MTISALNASEAKGRLLPGGERLANASEPSTT
jgi:hypothetical protein